MGNEEGKLERIANGLTNDGKTFSDLVIRAVSTPWAVWVVGSLRAEDQEEFVRMINKRPKLNGKQRNWKARQLTFANATIPGTIGILEHYLEGRGTAPAGLGVQLGFYVWTVYNLVHTAYRVQYSFGKSGKPMASYTPWGLFTNSLNYIRKKMKEKPVEGFEPPAYS